MENKIKQYIFKKWADRGIYTYADVAIKLRALLPPCSRFLPDLDPALVAYQAARARLVKELTVEFLGAN